MPAPEIEGMEQAVETVRALRAENGCPWDKAQTHESLRKYLLEETYEVLEALDALASSPSAENVKNFREELGDLLLQILLHSEISRQNGGFHVGDVSAELAAKLVRRHPHVFGGEKLRTPEEVLGAWEKTKGEEKKKDYLLDGIPAALPALQKSLKVIEKVSKVGFQWPDLKGPLEKMREELGEFEAEVKKLGKDTEITRESAQNLPAATKQKLEAELGDLLFTAANVAYFLHLNPEDALRSMLARFESRFRRVEDGAKQEGKVLNELSLEEMDRHWNEAKRQEKKG